MAEEPSASHSGGNEPWDAQRLARALAARDHTPSQYDTTLLCAGGHALYADGVVLAATSPFFKEALSAGSGVCHVHRSVLLLPQTPARLLSPLLDALYCQPVSVPRDQRAELIQLAADLQLPPGITRSISDGDAVLESSDTRDVTVTHQGATPAENQTLSLGAGDYGIQAGSTGFQANSGRPLETSHTDTNSSAVEQRNNIQCIDDRRFFEMQSTKKSSVPQPICVASTSTPAEQQTFPILPSNDATSQLGLHGSEDSQVRVVQGGLVESVRQAEKRPMNPSSSTAGAGKASTSGVKSNKKARPGTSREDCATVREPAGQEADASYRGNHSEQMPHLCNICDKPFSTRGNMLKHKRDVHYKNHPFKCTFCAVFSCSERGKLLKHILAKHSNTKQNLKSGISFPSAQRVSAKSNASRQTKRLFTCFNCEYSCVKKVAMKTHIKRNHESPDGCLYRCGYCTATFNSQRGLACHKTRAHEPKVPPVRVAEKRIEENFLNRGHANKLSLGKVSNNFSFYYGEPKVGGQSWLCAVCEYSTNEKGNLKRHMLTHTVKKP